MIKKIRQLLVQACVIIALWIGICGLAILGYQGFLFFRHGYWTPLKAGLLLCRILPTGFLQWLFGTTSWAWVHKTALFVFNLSLAAFLFILSCALFVLTRRAFCSCPRPLHKEEYVANWRR